MILRDYQQDAIDAVFTYMSECPGNPIVVMPGGTGKSVVIAGLIKQLFLKNRSNRVLMVTHVQELIEQNFEKIVNVWPSVPAGVYSAGLNRKDTGRPITFCGIQSVYNKPKLFDRVDYIVIDECHLVSPNDLTMYQKFVASLKAINPNLRVIGLTATDYRIGQGQLTESGGLFTDVCIDMTDLEGYKWFFDNGYLAQLLPKPMSTTFDISNVRISAGDYNERDLQLAIDKETITRAALEEAIECGDDREHWLVFGSGVQHVIHITDMLCDMGIPATCVHSDMPKHQRVQNIKDYKAGKYRAMVNNGILTTGFDYPEIDMIVVLRPTKSAALWVQILSRGTRPVYAKGYDLTTADGRIQALLNGSKVNCLVLDYARNTETLGPINDPVKPRKKGKKAGGEAPIRLCPACEIYCHASLPECPTCGYKFPREVKFEPTSSAVALIKEAEAPQIVPFKVDHIAYTFHEKKGKPVSMCVTYHCGFRTFSEWVCFEHEGYPKVNAHRWWKYRAPGSPIPTTTAEAIQRTDEITPAVEIKVWVNKKYPEITNVTLLPF